MNILINYKYKKEWFIYLPIQLALASLYIPTFINLFRNVWRTDDQMHGPIVLVVSVYLVTLNWAKISHIHSTQISKIFGWSLVLLGLIAYILGKSQNIVQFEVGSIILLFAGLLAAIKGWYAVKVQWLSIFFMLFMIPLPASLVDAATFPLKTIVSITSEYLLNVLGYPIARSGVILYMGQYQLLVADACAGLHSLFTLEALGLLYMNLIRHSSVVRNSLLALLIVPISITANTLRIVLLALITYYFGEAAGSGYLHGVSGIVLFITALLIIIAVDSLITWMVEKKHGKPIEPARKVHEDHLSVFPMVARKSIQVQATVFAILAIISLLSTNAIKPVNEQINHIANLERDIPKHIGQWQAVPDKYVQTSLYLKREDQSDPYQLYDDILMRSYSDASGNRIMLAIAYAGDQSQDTKIHRPEICYPAQGYSVTLRKPWNMVIENENKNIPGFEFIATSGGRRELVKYWLRTGQEYPENGYLTRLLIFKNGIAGKKTDGVLIRASSVLESNISDMDANMKIEQFQKDLYSILPDYVK